MCVCVCVCVPVQCMRMYSVCVCVCVRHSLQEGLGLAGRVVRAEVLVLVHLLLYRQQLALQLGTEPWQRVSDVIGQLLQGDGKWAESKP